MRSEALHARIQLQCLASMRPRQIDKPVEDFPAEVLRAVIRIGHEVINIQIVTRREIFVDSKASDRPHSSIFFEVCKPETAAHLTPYARNEVRLFNMGAQLLHHWEASPHLLVRLGFHDLYHCLTSQASSERSS